MYIDQQNIGGNLYDIHDAAARAQLPDEYSETTAYATGDYFIKSNVLYKVTSPMEAGTWDDSCVEATSIMNLIKELKTDVDANSEDINDLNKNFSFGSSVEEYTFDVSSEATTQTYTIKHAGRAFLAYVFNDSSYSQFWIQLNGVILSEGNFSSYSNNLNGLLNIMPFNAIAGDVITIGFYSTYRMKKIYLQILY